MIGEIPPEVAGVIWGYLWFLAAVVGYAFLCNRFMVALQPVRLRMAELGEQLVDDPSIPEADRDVVRILMGSAFNGWLVWLFALGLPFLFLIALIFLAIVPKSRMPREVTAPIPERVLFFGLMWAVSVVSLSPIAGLLIVIQIVIGTVLLSPYRKGREAVRAIARGLGRLASGRGGFMHT